MSTPQKTYKDVVDFMLKLLEQPDTVIVVDLDSRRVRGLLDGMHMTDQGYSVLFKPVNYGQTYYGVGLCDVIITNHQTKHSIRITCHPVGGGSDIGASIEKLYYLCDRLVDKARRKFEDQDSKAFFGYVIAPLNRGIVL